MRFPVHVKSERGILTEAALQYWRQAYLLQACWHSQRYISFLIKLLFSERACWALNIMPTVSRCTGFLCCYGLFLLLESIILILVISSANLFAFSAACFLKSKLAAAFVYLILCAVYYFVSQYIFFDLRYENFGKLNGPSFALSPVLPPRILRESKSLLHLFLRRLLSFYILQLEPNLSGLQMGEKMLWQYEIGKILKAISFYICHFCINGVFFCNLRDKTKWFK